MVLPVRIRPIIVPCSLPTSLARATYRGETIRALLSRPQRRCRACGIAFAVMVSERSDSNDDLVALGAQALAGRLRQLIVPIEAVAMPTIETAAWGERSLTPS